ncbi:hypothetical protein [Aliiglaciecola litoralis]|uniref:DUF1579 domain-containing protein n=1 Tax=Aliiglaciecola litoralis TaxID=582857 RepID=A0ABP3WYG4_9ALTE
MRFRLALFFLSLFSTSSFAACDSAKFNQFDFWIGEWNVFNQKGKLAGTNSITKQLNNCVLEEKYLTPSGYAGQSLNIYKPGTDSWHQTWVDNSGLLLTLEGQFDGTAMVLSGTTLSPSGYFVLHRITWKPAPDKSVRQHWQSSNDKGQSWKTLFDGKYVKRKK